MDDKSLSESNTHGYITIIDYFIGQLKGLFSKAPPPQLEGPAVPYVMKHEDITRQEIKTGDITRTEEFISGLYQKINDKKHQKLEIALAAVPLYSIELMPGESVETRDGKITYEQLQDIARNVDNVITKDASITETPKVFIFYKYSDKQLENYPILREVESYRGNNMLALPYYNAIVIGQKFLTENSDETIHGAYAHEVGHIIYNNTHGLDIPVYDPIRHAAILGEDFKQNCGSNDLRILNDSYDCARTAYKILSDRESVINSLKIKTYELKRKEEYASDEYATLAGDNYGSGLIELFKEHGINEFGNDDKYEYSSHPTGKERIEMIKRIMENPDSAKRFLESELAELKKPAFPVAEAGTEDKAPNPPPSLNQEPRENTR